MSLSKIDALPDESRLWIFAAERPLSESESQEFIHNVDQYLEQWKAHGEPVRAARDFRYNQFLFVAADNDVTSPSGCSIDDMTRLVRSLGEKLNVNFFGSPKVFYRSKDETATVERETFKELVARGEVSGDTIVFDTTITALGEVRNGKWMVPARAAWHARAFKLQ